MQVVIYRQTASDLKQTFDYLSNKLTKHDNHNITLGHKRWRIIFDNVFVDFFCGQIWRMAGMRVDVYNTDSSDASDFLFQSASKVNGVEVKNIDALYHKIIGGDNHGKKN